MTLNLPRFFNMPRRRDRIHSDKFFIFSVFRSSWGEELGKVPNTFVCNLVCLVRRLQSIDVGTANAEETWSNTDGERGGSHVVFRVLGNVAQEFEQKEQRRPVDWRHPRNDRFELFDRAA